jgi:hypothetical protein
MLTILRFYRRLIWVGVLVFWGLLFLNSLKAYVGNVGVLGGGEGLRRDKN